MRPSPDALQVPFERSRRLRTSEVFAEPCWKPLLDDLMCHHEGAHAVACVLLGIGLVSVDIIDTSEDDDFLGRCKWATPSDEKPRDREAKAVVCYASREAQKRLGGWNALGCECDSRIAQLYLREFQAELTPDPTPDTNQLVSVPMIRKASRLVRRAWPAVTAVAEELSPEMNNTGWLSGEAVAAIVGRVLGLETLDTDRTRAWLLDGGPCVHWGRRARRALKGAT